MPSCAAHPAVCLGHVEGARVEVVAGGQAEPLEDAAPDHAWQDEEFELFVVAAMGVAIELLGRLHQCAAVSIEAQDPSDGLDEDTGRLLDPGQARVELTPLGVYGTREYLLGTGCDAPVRDS